MLALSSLMQIGLPDKDRHESGHLDLLTFSYPPDLQAKKGSHRAETSALTIESDRRYPGPRWTDLLLAPYQTYL